MLRRALPVLLALGFSWAWVPEAAASPCGAGCAAVSHDCLWAATVEKLGCRMDCKGNGLGTDCSRACSLAARAARLTCRAEVDPCVDDCSPAGTCGGDCGLAADTCADPPGAALRSSCLHGCKDAFGAAKEACAGDPTCLLTAFLDLGTCYHGCADQLEALGGSCQADFDTCLAACGG